MHSRNWTGKVSVVSASNVQLEDDPVRIEVAPAEQGSALDVNVVKDGDQVIGVEIRCACGQSVRLKFDYATR